MILSAIRKEMKQALRNGRMALGCGLLLLLGLISCFMGWMDYQTQLDAGRDGNQKARGHWLAQEAKNPHSAAHYGVYVFKEPGAATLFDPGVQPFSGSSVFIEAHNKNDATWQPVRARTSLARFGNLNPAFFLIWLVPLVIMVLHFGAVAGERESGMLKAVAATGVSPRKWLFGKWLAAWILPALCLVGCMGLSLALSGGKDVSPMLWILTGIGYLLYLGSVINITLLVSSKMGTAPAALLTLLGFWMLGSLAVPRIAANTAERLFPTPLKQSFQGTVAQEKEAGLQDHMDQMTQETLAEHEVQETKDLPFNYAALSMQANEEFTDVLNDKHYQRLYAGQRNQNLVYRAFSVVWPLIPARFQSMTLARSDMLAHHHFNQETEIYRRDFVKTLNHDLMINSRTGEWGYRAPTGTWAETPEFQYTPRPAAAVAGDAAPDLAILLAWFCASGLMLFVSGKNLFRSRV